MINRFLITGDTHANFTRFKNYSKEIQQDPYTAIIILGDAGLNWSLDEHDAQLKNFLSKRYGFYIYCLRGNHEARPQDVSGMKVVYDENVKNVVYMQDKWPRIRYFMDYGEYTFNEFSVAVIGGAYSVDKWYRLDNGFRWFENEMLNQEEMKSCYNMLCNKTYDFVLSHTCPISWEPNDLFLPSIDQKSVDKSMEIFLYQLKDSITYNIWLCGHYHDDRLVRPHVEMFYNDTENINDIWERWDRYDKTGELDWWLTKDPHFYFNGE